MAACNRAKGARIDGINSAAGIPFSENYPEFLIIQSIRQFDNPFIPPFFHWSGRYIYPQLVETLVFTIVMPIDFYGEPVLCDLDEKSHHILSTIQFLNVVYIV
jgi:hypothetical protein